MILKFKNAVSDVFNFAFKLFVAAILIILFIKIYSMVFKKDKIAAKMKNDKYILWKIDSAVDDFHSPKSQLVQNIIGKKSAGIDLWNVIKTLKHAKDDPKVLGLIIKCAKDAEISFVQGEEIKKELAEFKAKGKKIYFYADVIDKKKYHVASSANEIWINEMGQVAIGTSPVYKFYFKNTLEKLGLSPYFMQTGKYKTYAEMFTQDSMSDEALSQISMITQKIDKKMAEVLNDRKIQNIDLVLKQNIFTPQTAMETKLIDNASSYYDLKTKLIQDDKKQSVIKIEHYNKYALKPENSKNIIAVVSIDGIITTRPISTDDYSGVDYDTIKKNLKKAVTDKNVKAIIVKIDSHGGDADLSMSIGSMIAKIKKKKPIVVSCGKVVASGGYLIASFADKIIANKLSLIGSIGVIQGKFIALDLLSKLGINVDKYQMNDENFDFSSPFEFLDEAQKMKMTEFINHYHNVFKKITMENRKLIKNEIENIANGKVWFGQNAMNLKLIDGTGGITEAISEAVKLSKVKTNDYVVKSYNGNKQGIIEMIVTNAFDAKLLSKVIISNVKNIHKNVSNVRLESDVGYSLLI